MIDTFMALWNRGSRHRGIKVFFTFSLVCISLSLFLVTVIIPGWILFTQNDSSMMTTNASNELLAAAPSTDESSTPLVPQTPLAVSATSTPDVLCVAPSPTPVASSHNVRASRSARGGSQALPAVPTAAVTTDENSHPKVFVEPHIVYSGQPRGAISHLQSSIIEASTPTATATSTVAVSSAKSAFPNKQAAPSPSASIPGGAHAHALFVPMQDDATQASKTSLTSVANSSPIRIAHQSIQTAINACVPGAQ
ncbi:MAG TPA: hypothetical protein VL485_14930 [Ktedonobacteraceae bacterium]|jgi:hypothetical protein|nr:hypothetical protein [Ktedonobacteraceae bacterium]